MQLIIYFTQKLYQREFATDSNIAETLVALVIGIYGRI